MVDDRTVSLADELWQSTMNSIADSVWVVDRDLRIARFSEGALDWCKALGLPVDKPVGRHLRDVFPFIEERVIGEYEAVFESGKPLTTAEHTVLGNRAVVTETRKLPFFDGDRVDRVVTVIRDVTEQFQALECLVLQRDLAQRLARAETVDAALDAWQEAVRALAQADVVLVYVGGDDPGGLRLARAWGLGSEAPAHVVSPPPGSFRDTMLLSTEPVYHDIAGLPDGEGAFLKREGLVSGAHIPVLCRGELVAACELGWRSTPAASEETRHRLETMAADLGNALARFRAMERLRQSEERLQLALSCPGFGLWDVDTRTMAAHPSPSLQRLLGMAAGDAHTRDLWWRQLEFHPDDEREFDETLWPELASGLRDDYDCELRVRSTDESWRWLRTRGHVAERDPDGQPVRLVAVVLDITEQREADEQRRQLEVRAQKLEGLSILAGGIAHDFSNILQAILGHAQYALDNTPTDAETRGSLEGIHEAAIRASELSRQMLAYAGRAKLESEPVSLTALADEMTSLLKASVSKKAELLCAFPDEPCTVLGDATQLRQVFLNLVTNASDALEDRPGTIRVEVGHGETWPTALASLPSGNGPVEGPAVFLRVEDTGCGMDANALSQMFDPFFTTKPTGRGLGLAAVLGIVQKHDGAVMVDSAIGAGTSIEVWLPASWEVVVPRPAPPSGASRARPSRLGTLLVVDDEPGIRETMQALLNARGYTVLTAADGVEAVELFGARHHEIRAVLMDLRMPRMSGEEALAEMRRVAPETPVFAVTAIGEPEGAVDLVDAGFVAVIHKPVVVGDLLARLESVLGD